MKKIFLAFIQKILPISLLIFSLPGTGFAGDVFDEELQNLLAKPTITKKTLPDGSIISTVSLGTNTDNGGTTAGYVTLPSGEKVQFSKSSAGTTTFMSANGATTTCAGGSCSGNSAVTQSIQGSLSAIESMNSNGSSSTTTVIVTEKVPGATCVCYIGQTEKSDSECQSAKVEVRLYKCSIDKGMTAFQNIIRDITKWFIYITMLFGVLALVGAGILWAWGSESEEYTKKAKGWALNIIVGLAILFSFRYILGFLAPWIFQ